MQAVKTRLVFYILSVNEKSTHFTVEMRFGLLKIP